MQAIEAMEKVPLDERRLRGATVAIDESLLPSAFKLIDEFCDSLADLMQNGKKTEFIRLKLDFSRSKKIKKTFSKCFCQLFVWHSSIVRQ